MNESVPKSKEPQLDVTRVCSPATDDITRRKRFRKKKKKILGKCDSLYTYKNIYFETCPRAGDHHHGFTAMP